MSTIQAVILAGGLGVRLRPLTTEIPKPMAPVAGKPYLEHQLRLLAEQEIRDIVLLTGYLGEQIEDYFRDGSSLGLSIQYSREREPLGTGGAILAARALLGADFLVIYGDSYLLLDYANLMRRLRASKSAGVLVVYDNRHGHSSVAPNIALSEDGCILRYAKDTPGAKGLTHVDAGVAALTKESLRLLEDGPRTPSLESDLYTKLIKRGQLRACETRQRFYDIGTPERLRAIEKFLSR